MPQAVGSAAASGAPRLDAGLKAVLDAENVVEPIRVKLLEGKHLSLKAFTFAFRSEAVLDKWFLKKLVEPNLIDGVTKDDYEFCDELACLRCAREKAKDFVGSSEAGSLSVELDASDSGTGTLLKLTDGSRSRALGLNEYGRLIKAFETKHPDEVLVDENTPAQKLVQETLDMIRPDKGLYAVLLRNVQSLADEKDARKAGLKATLSGEFTGSMDKLRGALVLRARAYIMASVGSLAMWNLYIETFMAAFRKRPGEKSGMRAPTVSEAAEAEFDVLTTVFDLVIKEGWSFDEALKDVTAPGRELRLALGQRLVTASGQGTAADAKRRKAQIHPSTSKAKNPAWVDIFPHERKPPYC